MPPPPPPPPPKRGGRRNNTLSDPQQLLLSSAALMPEKGQGRRRSGAAQLAPTGLGISTVPPVTSPQTASQLSFNCTSAGLPPTTDLTTPSCPSNQMTEPNNNNTNALSLIPKPPMKDRAPLLKACDNTPSIHGQCMPSTTRAKVSESLIIEDAEMFLARLAVGKAASGGGTRGGGVSARRSITQLDEIRLRKQIKSLRQLQTRQLLGRARGVASSILKGYIHTVNVKEVPCMRKPVMTLQDLINNNKINNK
eukprot:Tbor_TRINITY_DN3462_c0_g1::TRINITY_DN3462_c0_g1_i1::g.3725::m.3725